MTTVQSMFFRGLACAGVALMGLLAQGCGGTRDQLNPPDVLVAPYNTVQGDVLWAVAPLANESGASFVDTGMVSDALIAKIDEVRGVACLPLNRTLAAMRARGLRRISTPAEARQLAQELGVDGLIIGTITAYDPYDPPTLGLKLALFARNPGVDAPHLDPLKLQMSYTEFDRSLASAYLTKPVATVSEHLDGANHEVQMELQRYATGRHEPSGALGWRSMLKSMPLYTEFTAFVAVSRLIEQERLRVSRPVAEAESTPHR